MDYQETIMNLFNSFENELVSKGVPLNTAVMDQIKELKWKVLCANSIQTQAKLDKQQLSQLIFTDLPELEDA